MTKSVWSQKARKVPLHLDTRTALFFTSLRVSQKRKEEQERLGKSTTDALRPKTVICCALFLLFHACAAIDHAIPSFCCGRHETRDERQGPSAHAQDLDRNLKRSWHVRFHVAPGQPVGKFLPAAGVGARRKSGEQSGARAHFSTLQQHFNNTHTHSTAAAMVPRATLPLLLAIGAPAAAVARCSGANCPAWPAAVHIEGSYKEMSWQRLAQRRRARLRRGRRHRCVGHACFAEPKLETRGQPAISRFVLQKSRRRPILRPRPLVCNPRGAVATIPRHGM